MSDNRRTYRAIKSALRQLYRRTSGQPGSPFGYARCAGQWHCPVPYSPVKGLHWVPLLDGVRLHKSHIADPARLGSPGS